MRPCRWIPWGFILGTALVAGTLSCICGEDGSIVVGPGGHGHTSTGGGSSSTGGGGGSSSDDVSDTGGGSGDGWDVNGQAGGGQAGGDQADGGQEGDGGPGDGGQAGGGGQTGGGRGDGPSDPLDGGDSGGAGDDAGPRPPQDAGTPIPMCDLTDDGGCECLHIAILGFPAKGAGGDVLRDWIGQVAGATVVSLDDATLSPELLTPYRVIVVEDVREGIGGRAGIGAGIGRMYSPPEVRALQEWVRRGGGLVTLIGYTPELEVANVNRLLAPFGLLYGPANDSLRPVTHWASHPISRGVTRIPYRDGHVISGAGTLVAWEPNPGEYDTARTAELGAGRVFAWGDDSIADPEFLGQTEFQVARLWLNVLGWLVAPNQCRVRAPVSVVSPNPT